MTDVNTFHVLEVAFPPERMQTYLDAAEGNREYAAWLHARNAQLGATSAVWTHHTGTGMTLNVAFVPPYAPMICGGSGLGQTRH